MKRSRSIAGIAVVLSSAVIVGAGVMAHQTINRLSEAGDAVVRAKELELDYERLLSAMRDAETGQRGYLLTNDPMYLAPYDAALRELEVRLKTLADHVQADGGMVDELQPLRNFLQLKLAEISRTIELNRAGQHEAALDVVRSDQGRKLMDDIQ